MRKKARFILEMALLPPGYLLPPVFAAKLLEETLHEHFSEEDLSSGRRYLRRLKGLMDFLDPSGQKYQPAVRQIIAIGAIHG